MDPKKKLRVWWLFLLISTFICVPTAGYFINESFRVMELRREANRAIGEITTEMRKLVEIKKELAKESDRLTTALTKIENYENPDFLDFIEGRDEELKEIEQLLKNAMENLTEAEAETMTALNERDRGHQDIAEIALSIAKKKIKEAQQALYDYRHAI